MAATLYFHYFEKNDQLVVDHVSSNGISNSYVTSNNDRIDLSNLEDVKYVARANTDHDNVLHIDMDGVRYTLDALNPAIVIDKPIVNATLKVHDPNIDEDDHFSIHFNALCFHPDTCIKTTKGLVMIKNIQRGDMVETLAGFKKVSRVLKTDVVGEEQEFVEFPAHCIGVNMPYTEVLCTRKHPVGINFKNVPAEDCVGKLPGVNVVKKTVNCYYNLQLDTPEWLNVRGMFFTSHHPNHPVSPLPKDMYHNMESYRDGVFHESIVDFEDAQRSLV